MNNVRRKRLREAIELLEQAKWIIDEVKEEEQEYFDNMPEGIQTSERGEQMEEIIYNLEEHFDNIETIVDEMTDNCNLQ